jgi:hypothetical protein
MKFMAAANLFDNPLVLVAIVLFGALFSWLAKRRQAAAEASSNESESPPSGERGHASQQPGWQDLVRQLLGDETLPPATSPPPISRAPHDRLTSPTRRSEDIPGGTNQDQDDAVRPVVAVEEQAEHLVRAVRAAPRPHASVGQGAVGRWHNRRIVRRAFVASLIFAPPKGLET